MTKTIYLREYLGVNSGEGDCVICAWSLLFGKPYDEIRTMAKEKLGYDGRGLRFKQIGEGFSELNYAPIFNILHPSVGYTLYTDTQEQYQEVYDEYKDIVTTKGVYATKFARRNPKGSYFCISSGHAFVIKDGIIYGNDYDDRVFIKSFVEIKN